MNEKDYALLQGAAVLDKIQKTAGVSLEELQGINLAEAWLAKNRLDALGLEYPTPKAIGVREVGRKIATRVYRVKRLVSGKGFTSKNVIVYNIVDSIRIIEGLLWYHVSLTRSDDRMPTYDDLCWLKEHWLGDDKWAIQVFPSKDQHVSDHPRCLHLWSCMEDGFKLPDFRQFGTI